MDQRQNGGRPSLYTEEIAAEICERISLGETLPEVCADEHMPSRPTVIAWCESNPSFSDRYSRARMRLLDHWADDCVLIADNARNDYMDREVKAGRIVRMPDRELVQRSQLRIGTRQWLMARLRPDKYGDRPAGATELTVTVRSVLDAPPVVKQLPPGSGAKA